jgi:pyruvate,orthophosphate dikinase
MALRHLEDEVGRRLGDSVDPLLVSVRSGAKYSMPGMMETVLNVGLNDHSVAGLVEESGDERFAWDSYRRLIQMFGKTVLGVDGEAFASALDAAKAAKGVQDDVGLDAADLQRAGRAVQAARAGAHRPAVPAGPPRAAGPGDGGGVHLVEHRPRAALPTARAHPARPGDGGERLHDGLRQPG